MPKKFVDEPFCVSKKFWYQNFLCIGGGYHGFVENFLSHRTETKNFVREPFCVSESFWHGIKLWIRKGYHYSPLKFFCLTVPIKFGFQRFLTSINSTTDFYILCKRGGYQDFSWSIFLSHSIETFRSGTHLWFRKILVSKLFKHERGGGITVFRRNI